MQDSGRPGHGRAKHALVANDRCHAAEAGYILEVRGPKHGDRVDSRTVGAQIPGGEPDCRLSRDESSPRR
eukprot:8439706-Alexandrium_andersonii.AAC.1